MCETGSGGGGAIENTEKASDTRLKRPPFQKNEAASEGPGGANEGAEGASKDVGTQRLYFASGPRGDKMLEKAMKVQMKVVTVPVKVRLKMLACTSFLDMSYRALEYKFSRSQRRQSASEGDGGVDRGDKVGPRGDEVQAKVRRRWQWSSFQHGVAWNSLFLALSMGLEVLLKGISKPSRVVGWLAHVGHLKRGAGGSGDSDIVTGSHKMTSPTQPPEEVEEVVVPE
ncbi:hypothetical protein B0H12DRAFT_1069912 [Mycena haematopus]|nr:hypothetical protein B0H12DRAFT_1069912 [Mycena haematopus]